MRALPLLPSAFRMHFHSLPCVTHPAVTPNTHSTSLARQGSWELASTRMKIPCEQLDGREFLTTAKPHCPHGLLGPVSKFWLPGTSCGSGLPFQFKWSELCSCADSGCVPFSTTLPCVLGAWFTAQMLLGLARGWLQGSVNSPSLAQRGENLEYHHSCL